ncbi:dephospho-CoA kinase [Hydrogenophaga soli]
MGRNRHLVGLTGGIGSGKSTVAQWLLQQGARLVDADLIARSITAPQGSALAPIAQAFGSEMLLPDGGLNRSALRERVFNDPSARQQLENITHPMVAQEMAHAIAQCPGGVVVLDIPLLVESPRWRKRLDTVVVVDCTEQTQAHRVRLRNGWPEETIQGVMQAQAPRSLRLAAADMVIHNDGQDLDALRQQVTQLAHWLGL